ncbi:nucleoside deaminase [Streptomyces sp. NPDC053499]|uniref:nucleoside deaminase n=1 Tax=Streptomyces sp. NPDC053499 TaxID=3365707 RepID=UPI0037CF250D
MTFPEASRRRFLHAAAAAAPTAVLGTPAPATAHAAGASADPARNRERPSGNGEHWSGTWPDGLRDAVSEAMPVAVAWARGPHQPFGAVLVHTDTGDIAAGAGNTTERFGDRTAHAELDLLREAAAVGLRPASYAVVSTAEPCAMCAGALVWAGVRAVAFGTSIAKLVSYGLPQIDLPFDEIVRRSPLPHLAVGRDVRPDLTDPLYKDLMR